MRAVIVGAGIAGACAAYFAKTRGAQVTLIDAARERASDVPVALVNPVRGTAGKVIEGGFAATRFTFSLIDQLAACGHFIPHGRGLLRPVPDQARQADWHTRMPEAEAWRWQPVDAALNLADTWYQALFLPEAGWIETRPMLDALIEESRAEVILGDVAAVDASASQLVLSDGRRVGGDLLLWCGGALGAQITGGEPQNFRPGSVLILERPLSLQCLSYGIYAAPYREQGVVGSTSEPPAAFYSLADNPAAVARLERRVAVMWHDVPATAATFRAVRFQRVTPSTSINTLDGFGSRGFLLAPSAAHLWAERTFS
jgi:glycine/D-amino acid oxidase-like deaminating enzyme